MAEAITVVLGIALAVFIIKKLGGCLKWFLLIGVIVTVIGVVAALG